MTYVLCSLTNGAYFVYDDKYNSVEKDGEEDGYEHRNGQISNSKMVCRRT